MKDYEIKLSQFIDNELPADKQQELFHFLSENKEARKILADYMKIKNETKSFYKEMNTEFDDTQVISSRIYTQKENERKYKMMFYFSAAATIVLAFLFGSSFFKSNISLEKYQRLQTKYIIMQKNYSNVLNEKKRLVNLTDKFVKENENLKTKQVSIKHNLFHKSYSIKIKKKPARNLSYKNRNTYFANIPTYTITKNDFLGQQIIGN